ncbi:CHAT domain-containing tetratricopeptide repeat protein [Azospirillum argentinense]
MKVLLQWTIAVTLLIGVPSGVATAAPKGSVEMQCADLTTVDDLLAAKQMPTARRILRNWRRAQQQVRADLLIRMAWVDLDEQHTTLAANLWSQAEAAFEKEGAVCGAATYHAWNSLITTTINCSHKNRLEECKEHLRSSPRQHFSASSSVFDTELATEVWKAHLASAEGNSADAIAILERLARRKPRKAVSLIDVDLILDALPIARKQSRHDLILALTEPMSRAQPTNATELERIQWLNIRFQRLNARLESAACFSEEAQRNKCQVMARELRVISNSVEAFVNFTNDASIRVRHPKLVEEAEREKIADVVRDQARFLRSNIVITDVLLSDLEVDQEIKRQRLLTKVDQEHVDKVEYHWAMHVLERNHYYGAAIDHLEEVPDGEPVQDRTESLLQIGEYDLQSGASHHAERSLSSALERVTSEPQKSSEKAARIASLLIEAMISQGKTDRAEDELRTLQQSLLHLEPAQIEPAADFLQKLSHARIALALEQLQESRLRLDEAVKSAEVMVNRPDLMLEVLILESDVALANKTAMAPERARALFRNYVEAGGNWRLSALELIQIMAESLTKHLGPQAMRRELTDLVSSMEHFPEPAQRQFYLASILGDTALTSGMTTQAIADYRYALSILEGDHALSRDLPMNATARLRLAQSLVADDKPAEAALLAAAARQIFLRQPRRHERELAEIAALPVLIPASPDGAIIPTFIDPSLRADVQSTLSSLKDAKPQDIEVARKLLKVVQPDSSDAFMLAFKIGQALLNKRHGTRLDLGEALLFFEQASKAKPLESALPDFLGSWASTEMKLERFRQARWLYEAQRRQLAYRLDTSANAWIEVNLQLAKLDRRLEEPYSAAITLRDLGDTNCDVHRELLNAVSEANAAADESPSALRRIQTEFGSIQFDCTDRGTFVQLADRLNGRAGSSEMAMPWIKPGVGRNWQARRLEHAIANALAAAQLLEQKLLAAATEMKTRDLSSLPTLEWQALENICGREQRYRGPSDEFSLTKAHADFCRSVAERVVKLAPDENSFSSRRIHTLVAAGIAYSLLEGDTDSARRIFDLYQIRIISEKLARSSKKVFVLDYFEKKLIFEKRLELATDIGRQGVVSHAGVLLDWLEADLLTWQDERWRKSASQKLIAARVEFAALEGDVGRIENILGNAVAAQDVNLLELVLYELERGLDSIRRAGHSEDALHLAETAMLIATRFRLEEHTAELHAREASLYACQSEFGNARTHYDAGNALMEALSKNGQADLSDVSEDLRGSLRMYLQDAALTFARQALASGDTIRSWELMGEVRRLASIAPHEQPPPAVSILFARISAAVGRWDEVQNHVTAALRNVDSFTFSNISVQIANWYMEFGKREEAMNLLAPVLTEIRQRPHEPNPPYPLSLPYFSPRLADHHVRTVELALRILDDGTPEGQQKSAEMLQTLGLWRLPRFGTGEFSVVIPGNLLDAPEPLSEIRRRLDERVLKTLARIAPAVNDEQRIFAVAEWAQHLTEGITSRALERAHRRAMVKDDAVQQILRRLSEYDALLHRRVMPAADERSGQHFQGEPCAPLWSGSLYLGLGQGLDLHWEPPPSADISSLIADYASLAEDTISGVMRQDFSSIERKPLPWPDIVARLQVKEGLLMLIPAEDGVVRIAARGGDGHAMVDWIADREALRNSTAQLYRTVREMAPFSPRIAHVLYSSLFGGLVAEHFRNVDHVFLVPGSEIQALPFNALVVDPKGGALSDLIWLDERYTFSILPNAAALAARAGIPHSSAVRKAFLGIGAPVLTGAMDECTKVTKLTIDDTGLGRPEDLRRLCPLPRGPTILAGMQYHFSRNAIGSEQQILYGGNATESNVKAMSDCKAGSGDCQALRDYKIIVFMTHGILASEFTATSGQIEPALVLTPPDTPTERDDGLLTLSEIAKLDLDAELVMLLACNTAGPDGQAGGQPLSGLARAFMDAGAQNLIVSQWSVGLTPAEHIGSQLAFFISERISIPLALRKAQRAYREQVRHVTDAKLHPGYWAPFIIVGGF